MSNFNNSIAVLGGGISGLSAGYALKKAGFEVTVYEKSETSGGVIQSRRQNGWLVETGPNTLLAKDKELWNLFDELNVTDHITGANDDAKKRYIVRDGKLHSVPASLSGFLTTPLLSTSAKLRLLKEPFVASSNKKDETIASFITRRFGKEPLDYAINPFVAGVYAGDPKRLSVKHTFSSLFMMEQNHGTVLKGLIKKKKKNSSKKALISFDKGMQALPKQLQKKLDDSLQLQAEISGISKLNDNWSIEVKKDEQLSSHHHATIISTLPPVQLKKVWNESKSKEAVNEISKIEYTPVSVLALGFKRKQINHPLDGFGFLVPEKEDFNILGCFFSSSLFENRAPKNHVLLTCFIGGTRNPDLAGEPTEKLISTALKDLNELLSVKGDPVFREHIYWPRAIPQFNLGHDTFLNAADEIEKQNPGFFIGGNFISGVSVPDCIISSLEITERIKTFME